MSGGKGDAATAAERLELARQDYVNARVATMGPVLSYQSTAGHPSRLSRGQQPDCRIRRSADQGTRCIRQTGAAVCLVRCRGVVETAIPSDLFRGQSV